MVKSDKVLKELYENLNSGDHILFNFISSHYHNFGHFIKE